MPEYTLLQQIFSHENKIVHAYLTVTFMHERSIFYATGKSEEFHFHLFPLYFLLIFILCSPEYMKALRGKDR
jgi:hypothetical protein